MRLVIPILSSSISLSVWLSWRIWWSVQQILPRNPSFFVPLKLLIKAIRVSICANFKPTYLACAVIFSIDLQQ